MFTIKTDESIDVREINLVISKIIMEIIEKNIPHKLIATEEPFENTYNGRISYDYSGEVRKMTSSDLKSIIKDYNPNDSMTFSRLDYLLEETYIDSWTATYQSNCGKNWSSYKDITQEKFNEWKNENFKIWDGDGEYCKDDGVDMEQIDIELDEIFEMFLKNTSADLYLAKILKILQVESRVNING